MIEVILPPCLIQAGGCIIKALAEKVVLEFPPVPFSIP